VARVIQEDILRLQIPINDVESMKAFESTQELSRVKSSAIDLEFLLFLQMVEQLTAVDECLDKVKLFKRLKREFQRDDEWIVDLGKDRPFGQRMCNLGSRDNVCLSNCL
jgi:hypothetical protein